MSLFVKTQHIESINDMIHVYGDNYKAYYAAAEILYVEEHGKLPEWAIFIERVERVKDAWIFVHRDPKKVN